MKSHSYVYDSCSIAINLTQYSKFHSRSGVAISRMANRHDDCFSRSSILYRNKFVHQLSLKKCTENCAKNDLNVRTKTLLLNMISLESIT